MMKIGVENLIRNGHAEYGDNTNFDDFVYEATGGVVGGAGCFSKTGKGIVFNDDFIPIDPNDSYELSLFWKTGLSGTKIYGGFEAYDENKIAIHAQNSYRDNSRDSTLYADYHAGDLTVKITPAASAWTVGYYMQFGVLDYGMDQPNFNISKITAIDDSDPSFWLITLDSALSDDFSAGSACGIADSDYYSYCLGSTIPGTSFVRTSAEIAGQNRWNEKRSYFVFPRGTRFIRVVILANYLYNTGDTTYIDGVTLRRVR